MSLFTDLMRDVCEDLLDYGDSLHGNLSGKQTSPATPHVYSTSEVVIPKRNRIAFFNSPDINGHLLNVEGHFPMPSRTVRCCLLCLKAGGNGNHKRRLTKYHYVA